MTELELIQKMLNALAERVDTGFEKLEAKVDRLGECVNKEKIERARLEGRVITLERVQAKIWGFVFGGVTLSTIIASIIAYMQ